MDTDGDYSLPCTPPELVEAANAASLDLLPAKSREKYELAYQRFMDFCRKNNSVSFSENVLMAYVAELAKTMKSSTLWAHYSMLRSTLSIKNNINIAQYHKLRAFLKRQAIGYKPKKSKILTQEQVQKFILEASDDIFLSTKVSR